MRGITPVIPTVRVVSGPCAGPCLEVELNFQSDTFTVSQIRKAGGVVIGKTNMPPMANGGMQRGVYGRAESPYNGDYLAAAFASGSSNDAGASTAASMAVFAIGEETVSFGRPPASNNGLVAYTPSRGSRSFGDMFSILDVIAAPDEDLRGDFWRGQPFVSLPAVSSVRPEGSYHALANSSALLGKRIGVPKMYIGEEDAAAQPVWISPAARKLWDQARITLESLGGGRGWTDYLTLATVGDLDLSGPGDLWSYGWVDFLHYVNDTNSVTRLADLPGTLPDRYGNRFGNRSESNTAIVKAIAFRNGTSIYALPGLESHLTALEARRKRDL
ncbi:amidase, partial [Colletotrichum sojae]